MFSWFLDGSIELNVLNSVNMKIWAHVMSFDHLQVADVSWKISLSWLLLYCQQIEESFMTIHIWLEESEVVLENTFRFLQYPNYFWYNAKCRAYKIQLTAVRAMIVFIQLLYLYQLLFKKKKIPISDILACLLSFGMKSKLTFIR